MKKTTLLQIGLLILVIIVGGVVNYGLRLGLTALGLPQYAADLLGAAIAVTLLGLAAWQGKLLEWAGLDPKQYRGLVLAVALLYAGRNGLEVGLRWAGMEAKPAGLIAVGAWLAGMLVFIWLGYRPKPRAD
jgi:hypothetical protein